MQHVRDLPEFDSQWLWAHDLQGKDVTLTIDKVTIEKVYDFKTKKKIDKTVISFKELANRKPEDQKRLVAVKTNLKSIESVHGSNPEKWPGKKITLYGNREMAFGEMRECIRVRVPVKTRAV